MVDLDRKSVGSKKYPATDDELRRADDLINRSSDYAMEIGWGRPHKVMSGNGYHLYFALSDLENDYESDRLIKSLLEILAQKFDTEEFGIDTLVYDAARITKIIGTVARKGSGTQERPYRTVELIR